MKLILDRKAMNLNLKLNAIFRVYAADLLKFNNELSNCNSKSRLMILKKIVKYKRTYLGYIIKKYSFKISKLKNKDGIEVLENILYELKMIYKVDFKELLSWR